MANSFKPHNYANYILTMGGYGSDKSMLYRWTGTFWQALDDDEARRDAYHWLVRTDADFASDENARKAVRAAMLFLEPIPELTSEVVVPCRNGYVRIIDNEFRVTPPDPTLGLQYVLDCEYQSSPQPTPRFTQFLARILPDQHVRDRVQEYVGYTLIPDARFQRAQLWFGEGANGKGVLANIVQRLHGRVAAISLDALDGFRLSVLVGASLAYADEVPRVRINEQILKSLIAGERVQIDRKHKEPLSTHVRAKWLVLGNHLPAVTDHSTGFWRRWDVVPFSVTIPERERDSLLTETIIHDELSGVLSWALDGLKRLLARGRFDPVMPGQMASLLSEVKSETNSVLAWLGDCGIELGTACITPKDQVFSHYKLWCERNALSVVGSVQFWKRLRDSLHGLDDARSRRNGAVIRVCNVSPTALM